MMRANVRGGTLIEMVIAIVIISVALIGMFNAMNAILKDSVDPVKQVQGVAIAKSVLEGMRAKPFAELQSESWEVFQEAYLGTAILENIQSHKFTVRIEVSATEALPNISAAKAKRIDVILTHLVFPEEGMTLSSYRVGGRS